MFYWHLPYIAQSSVELKIINSPKIPNVQSWQRPVPINVVFAVKILTMKEIVVYNGI